MKTCYFCGKTILEDLVVHSLDGDHENWDPANKVDAHRSCHSGFHASRQVRIPWSRMSSRVRIQEPLLLKIEEAIEDGVCSSVKELVFMSIEMLLDECYSGSRSIPRTRA